MNINKNNYESWFLDYFEGTLSAERTEELFVFLGRNPELKEVFESFEMVTVYPEKSVIFEGKESLKKNGIIASGSINAANYTAYLLSETEGLLSQQETDQLEVFMLLNPRLEKERNLFKHTHLQADPSVLFAGKNRLKHKAIPASGLNDTNYEELLIAELEKTITPSQAIQLSEFLASNPHLERERRLFALTKLEPSGSMQFPRKALLKKRAPMALSGKTGKFLFYSLSVAASVVLLLGLFLVYPPSDKTGKQPSGTAQISKANPTPPVLQNKPVNERTGSKQVKINGRDTQPEKQTIEELQKENRQVIQYALAQNTLSHAPDVPLAQVTDRINSSFEKMDLIPSAGISSRTNASDEYRVIRLSHDQLIQNEILFSDIAIARSIEYARMNTPDPNPGRTLLRALAFKATDKYVDNRRSKEEESPEPEFSGWTVAEVGIKAFNTLTNSNVALNLQKDEEGRVISYALKGDKIDVEQPVGR